MARLTGSLQVDGNISADSFTGSVQGTATTASHALSVPFNTISDLPDNLVSASSQIILTDTTGNISGSRVIGDIAASSVDYDNVNNKPTLISSSAQVDLASATGTATNATTASYVDANNIDGEVYEAERARRIEVGSYISYSSLTDIPFITGDYGNSVKRISADGLLQWHAGTNHLTVPGVDATTLTGSLDWDQLENVPDGIMSSSDGVIPDGTVSSSAQTISNLNSTGIVSGSSQITNITIKEQNGNNTYPVLFANTSNPSGDFQGQAAYAQITGGTERIRFNPGTGLLELGNLLGSGSIYAYGGITADEFTSGRAVNAHFFNLQAKAVNGNLPATGPDSYLTLSATSSKDNYQLQFENGSMFDPMWSYKGGGYGNQWTRVLTEQNIASGSATLTQIWVNGLVTGSTAEFTTISGSTISGSFVGDGSGLTGLTVDSVDYDNVNNKPTLLSSSAQINFDTDPINIAIGGTSLGSVYRLERGNVAVGAKAYECVTNVCDLEQNVAIGLCAGRSIDSDSLNSIFIGHTAGGETSACQNSNIGIGVGAHSCGGGTGNVSLGSVAGQDTTGDYNVAIGFTAARDNVGGDGNIVIGGNAGRCLTGNGSYHVLLGYNAGSTTFFNENQFSTDESGSVFAVNAGTGNEPLIHSRFKAWGGVKDYFQINAPTSASSFEAASLTGSLDFSDVNNKPTLFSGSSQVDFDNITNVPDELISASNGDVTLRGVLELSEGPSIASTQRNLIIGLGADHIKDSSVSYNNTVIGVESGQGMQSGSRNNTLIGDGIMYNDGSDALGVVTSNTVIGHESMQEGYGIGNIVLGRQSLLRATSANSNIVIGNNTLDTDDYNGSSTIVIGNTAGDHLTGGSLNILIGDSAGPTSNTSLTGKLYIDVEESDTPLIYGDFVSDEVTINGDLDVTGTTSGSFIGDGSGLTGVSVDSVTSASFASKAGSLEKFENIQSVNGQHAILMTFASESAGQSNGRAGFAGTNTSQGSLRFNPNRSGDGSTAELSIGNAGVTGILDVDRIDMGADIIINEGIISLLGVQNGGFIQFYDVDDPSSSAVGSLWRDGSDLYYRRSSSDKSRLLTTADKTLTLDESDPLPSGTVGMMAVSASALYFHNGSDWSQIS